MDDKLTRFAVSGWDDDLNDIDTTRNPEGKEKDFLSAAQSGDLVKVQELYEQDPALLKGTDQDRYTALHRACYGNHVDVVKFLISKGADVAAETEMGWQPLHSSCQWNNKECAAILLQNGADVNAKSEGSQTPLHVAATHGANYDTVQLLLMHPLLDASIVNNSNETATDLARRSSKYYNIFDAVDPLLDYKHTEDLI